MKANPSPVPSGTFNGVKFTGVLQASFLHWCDLNGVTVINSDIVLEVNNRQVAIPFILPTTGLIINVRPDVANHSTKRKDALIPMIAKINKEGVARFKQNFVCLFSEYFANALTLRQIIVHPKIELSTATKESLNELAIALAPSSESVLQHKVIVPKVLKRLIRL